MTRKDDIIGTIVFGSFTLAILIFLSLTLQASGGYQYRVTVEKVHDADTEPLNHDEEQILQDALKKDGNIFDKSHTNVITDDNLNTSGKWKSSDVYGTTVLVKITKSQTFWTKIGFLAFCAIVAFIPLSITEMIFPTPRNPYNHD